MKMPALALRGMVILPGMIAHFDVSREKSIHAVEQSMMDEQKIFLVAQRDVEQDNITIVGRIDLSKTEISWQQLQ